MVEASAWLVIPLLHCDSPVGMEDMNVGCPPPVMDRRPLTAFVNLLVYSVTQLDCHLPDSICNVCMCKHSSFDIWSEPDCVVAKYNYISFKLTYGQHQDFDVGHGW